MASNDKAGLQEAIDRALKVANRAIRAKNFGKVADIYYRVASMLNDLGDQAGAARFSSAAKQFKEKNQVIEQINEAYEESNIAYNKGDYTTVAENYFKISSLSELIGDMKTAKQFKMEAEKFLTSLKSRPEAKKEEMKTMTEIAPAIQSQVPSSVDLNRDVQKLNLNTRVDLGDAMLTLGLICPHCGSEINPELDLCPKCNKPI